MGGGDDETTTVIDPWKNMPDWMKEAYESEADFRERVRTQGEDVAARLAESPREVLQLSDLEKTGLKTITGGIREADELGDRAVGQTAKIDDLIGQYLDPARGFVNQSEGLGDKTRRYTDTIRKGIGATGKALEEGTDLARKYADNPKAAKEAMKAAGFDLDALREKYGEGYTDDVVNTTLAGMQREADRERLRREGQAAATGGTTNTRRAVADAVSQQLTGLNMADVEAKLRDQGFTRAIEAALGEGGLQLERAGVLDTLGVERGRLLDQITDTEVSGLRGMTADRMGVADLLRGLSGDELERAKVMDMLARSGLDIRSTGAELFDRLAGSEMERGLKLGATQGAVGELDRSLRQESLDETRTAEQQSLGWLADLFSGTTMGAPPVGSTETSTTSGGPSPFQQILGAGATAAGLALQSDERVKENVETLESALGALREVEGKVYDYKPGFGHTRERTTGMMAQDWERAGVPGAVLEIGGIKHVDLYPIVTTVAQAAKELDARTAVMPDLVRRVEELERVA